jgi:hypothetical protein
MFFSGFFHPESFISLGISAAAMDDSQLDEEQRAPSAGPVQQVLFHLVPVSRTQSVDAFFAAQTGGAAAAAAAEFFAANNIDPVPVSRSLNNRGRAAVLNFLADVSEHHADNQNKVAAVVPFSNYSLPTTPKADAVPVARTQSVDAFSSLPATQLSGAFACSCPLSRSLTDRSRAAVLNLLVEISEYHANNQNKVAAGVPFSNFSKYSLPTTPEADAVSVEVIFVCLFFIQ